MAERKCSSYVSYQNLANWLCVTFLHSAQRTTQNQSSKSEILAYFHEKNPDSEKQVLKQKICLFHTALEEGRTSDRHCLTLKPVSLPRGKSVIDTQIGISPCFPFTSDCSLLGAAVQTSKWKKCWIAPKTPSMGSPFSVVHLVAAGCST